MRHPPLTKQTLENTYKKCYHDPPTLSTKLKMKSLVITGNYEEFKQETPESWAKDKGRRIVAEVKIDDGIIKVVSLEIQDHKIAKILEEYPENR